MNDKAALEETGGIDPGVPHDPALPEPVKPIDESKLEPVKVAAVKRALVGASSFANAIGGQAARADLTIQPHEADLLAPGIVKYINGRPTLMLAVATGGDEYLQTLVGGALYGWRIFQERAAALEADAKAAQEAAEQTLADPPALAGVL